MNDVFITAIAAALPGNPIDNDTMESVLGMAGGRPSRARKMVLRSNGIKQRYYAIDPQSGRFTHSNAQLTAEAIRKLSQDGIDVDSMECLVCGTTSGDQLMPGHALMTQAELGITNIAAITTAGICLAGVTALEHAWLGVASGRYSNAVASGSEVASPGLMGKNFETEIAHRVAELEGRPEIAFEKDFLRWMLSDGAGAVWLSPEPKKGSLSLKIDWLELRSYAPELPVCMYRGLRILPDGQTQGWQQLTQKEWLKESIFSVQQDVKLLNENIVHFTVEKPLKEIIPKYKLDPLKIDYFLPHYSSEYFRDRMADGLKRVGFEIPMEKWFTNLPYKGNTGSASIFIILEELFHSGKFKAGDRLLCFIPESGRFSTAFMHLTVVA